MFRPRLSHLALLLFFAFVSCWDDSPTAPTPTPPAADTTKRDTSKTDTSRKDTTKVDTTKRIVGPAGSDSLTAGQKSKDIQLGGVVGAGLSVTWVKFEGTSGHTYTFTYLPRGSGTLQVYLLTGKDTLTQVSTPRTGDSIVFPCTRAGTYLVKVVGPSGTKPTLKVGENNLLPMYFVGGDSFEPDYDTAHATTWDFKNTSQGHTNHYTGAMDTDWVRIPVDSGTTLTVNVQGTFTMVPSIGRPEADLFGSDGAKVSWNGYGGNWTLANFRTQTVYLRLRATDTVTVPYSLAIQQKAGLPSTAVLPDAFEPDPTADRALVLGLDTAGLSRTLHGDVQSQDIDWVRIQADSGTTYRIQTDANDPLGVDLLSSAGVRQILRDSVVDRWGHSHSWAFACTRSGQYGLRIQGGTAESYRLRMTVVNGLPTWTAQPDSLEPDDSRAQAVAIKFGEVNFRRNLTFHDTDWFEVEVDSGTIWTLSLRNRAPANGNQINGFIQDANSAVVAVVSATAQSPGIWSHQFVRAGRYLLRLAGDPSLGGIQIPYDLQSVVARGTDPLEPDSSRRSALVLQPDGKWLSRSLHPLDDDWMKVRVAASSRVTFYLEHSSNIAALGLHLYGTETGNQNETPIGYFWFKTTSSDSLSFFAPTDTMLYFRVHADNFSTAFTDWTYRIRARVETVTPDALEPDQTKNDARVLPNDSGWIRRNLFSGDQDWMALDVPDNKIVHMQATGAAFSTYSAVAARMIGPDGREIGGNWSGMEWVLYVPEKGRYLLQFSADTTVRSVIDYSAKAWFESYPDNYEPDNELAQARPLLMDSSAQSHRLMPGDTADWIVVSSAGRQARWISMTEPYQGMPFELRRADGSLVKAYTATEAAKGVVLARADDAATYLVKIKSTRTVDYVVRGWTIKDPDPFEASDSPLLAPLVSATPTARWTSKGDTDLFRLHLEPGQSLRMLSTGNVRWTLFSPAGDEVTNDLAQGRYYHATAAVDYLVRVVPSTSSDAYQPYSMAIVPMQLDTAVLHRTRSQAISVASADSLLHSATTSYADTVWFRVHLDPGQNVVVQANSKGRIVAFSQEALRLRDSLGSLALFYQSATDTCLYLGFVPRQDSLELRPISVRVSSRLADAYEPDNTIATASKIDSGLIQDRILMVDDTDFIELPAAPSGASWSVAIQFSDITVGTDVARPDGQTLGFNDYLSPGDSWTIFPSGTGPFYLRLIGMKSSLRPQIVGTRYRIRVTRK